MSGSRFHHFIIFISSFHNASQNSGGPISGTVSLARACEGHRKMSEMQQSPLKQCEGDVH